MRNVDIPGFKSRDEKRAQTFAIRFLGTFLLFLGVATQVPDRFFDPLKTHTAFMAGFCLNALGGDVTIEGVYLIARTFRVHIVTECTFLYSAALFVCFVLSYPVGFSWKIKGILFGLPILDMINILRIVVTFSVGVYSKDLFPYIHVYLGEIGMAVMTVWSVMVWLGFTGNRFNVTSGSGFALRVIALATLLFFPWVWLQTYYVRGIDCLLGLFFNVMGAPIYFTYGHAIYVQTFNMVTFLALMLATRRIDAAIKAVWIIAGLSLIVLVHVAFRVGNVFLTAWHVSPSLWVTSLFHLAGQFLVPLLVWFCMVTFGKNRKRT